MNEIIFTESLSPEIKKIIVHNPLIAERTLPGQFIVLLIDEQGERVPLTVVQTDQSQGTFSLIFQQVGKTTFRLGQLKTGAKIQSILGPLGKATEIKKLGTIVTIGGGVGVAEVYPVTKAFKDAGNRIISIIGARSKNILILEKDMREVSDALYVATDDGSYGRKGFVSDILKEMFNSEKIDLIYAVGPVPMMRAIAGLSRPYNIKTLVSLNPIMVDATGMCGACRVSLGKETKFACVDGPEFDAHQVDFDQLEKRLKAFCGQEQIALKKFKDCCHAAAND